MYGAIIGDICGSIYEWHNRKTDKPEEIELVNERCSFTDDSVLAFAVAEAVLTDRNYQDAVFRWANRYPDRGFGGWFYAKWIQEKAPQPYNSFGNGSAMRVSPVGWAFSTLKETLEEAKR